MKRIKNIITLLLFLVISVSGAFAAKDTSPQIKFDNKVFKLKYSQKPPELNTYINEYFKAKDGYDNWKEMIGVYHFTDTPSAIELVKKNEAFYKENGGLVQASYDDKNDIGVIIFTAQSTTPSPNIEYNIFRYEKYNQKDVIGIQYVRRYFVEPGVPSTEMLNEVNANSEKWLNSLMTMPQPKVVEEDIDLGK